VEHLIRYCHENLHVNLNEKQINQFIIYQNELQKWNRKFNLTSITDPVEIEIKHFIDSLTCLMAVDTVKINNLIDIGTGAGFPGIPIKILYPQIHLTLIEANQKKAGFCSHLIAQLQLTIDNLLIGRAEQIAHEREYRGKFDIAVARAVASLPTLMEYLLPYVKQNGIALAMKGKDIQKELTSAETAINLLGGRLESVTKYRLPIFNQERNLVIVRKFKPTPEQYPRRPGIPAKKPLMV